MLKGPFAAQLESGVLAPGPFHARSADTEG
jgi:hypothetical protein